jgi:lactate 2-monooxygenase
MASLGEFQNEIYLGGLADKRPLLPTDLTQLEALARQHLSAETRRRVYAG